MAAEYSNKLMCACGAGRVAAVEKLLAGAKMQQEKKALLAQRQPDGSCACHAGTYCPKRSAVFVTKNSLLAQRQWVGIWP
eukprot:SAG31_NODE_3156_length_4610_cov_12.728663_3_plen_80_part_00